MQFVLRPYFVPIILRSALNRLTFTQEQVI